jgi:hypothetical protein
MAQPGYLAELVDPQSEFAKPKEANRYFIDRDGEHFGHILNYLRTPKLNKALKPEVVSALRIEADFYLLSDLVTELKFIYPARLAKNKAKQSEDENMIVVKHLDYYMSIFLYQDQTRGTKKLMKIYNKPPTDDIWQICSAYTEGKKFPSDGRKAEYHVHKKMLQKGFAFFDVEDTRKTIMREFKSLITMEWDSREWPRHLLDAIR